MMRYVRYFITKGLFLLLITVGFNSLTGCSPEAVIYPAPEIKLVVRPGFITGDTTLMLNDTVRIELTASTESNQRLTHLHAIITKDTTVIRIDTALYTNQLDYIRKIIKGIAKKEVWSFYVRDRDGRKSNEIVMTLNLNPLSVYGDIRNLPLISLGAQNNASTGSFYSLSEGLSYNTGEAFGHQSSVNLLYYYDLIDVDKNTIASPGANIDASVYPGTTGLLNWTVKPTTRFLYLPDISPSDFDLCRNDSLILATTFEFESGKRKAKDLSGGQVYSFVTDTGLRGLFKVTSVIGEEQGTIGISIKIKK